MILGLIGFLGFFACLVLLIAALFQKKPKKPFEIGLAAFLVLFCVAALTSPPAEGDTSAGNGTEISESATIEKSLTKIAKKCISNGSVPFSVVLNDGACVVHCESGDTPYFDETDIVRSNLSAYIKFCLEAYKTGEVSSVDWWAESNMIDRKGNSNSEKVIQFEMPKETFETYNWENMEYRKGMYSQFSSDCTTCYIHPGILSKIDTDNDIFYVP